MKIRNSFVANSSSSSFIIGYKENVCQCCKRSSSIISTLFSNTNYSHSDESRSLAKGKEEIIEYFINDYWMNEEEAHSIRRELDKKEWGKMMLVRLSYCDETMREYIKQEVASGNAEILWGDLY